MWPLLIDLFIILTSVLKYYRRQTWTFNVLKKHQSLPIAIVRILVRYYVSAFRRDKTCTFKTSN